MRSSIAIAFLVLSAAGVATGQEAADKYLLLAAERSRTMQQEINDAAAKGYRVVSVSPSEGSEAIYLLEQTKGMYQYLLLAATRTNTLQREISDAAQDGYRLVPRSMTHKGDEWLVLMEKGPEGPARAQYQVLATERTGTLQKEIGQAAVDGYTLVAVASHSQHVAILERGAR